MRGTSSSSSPSALSGKTGEAVADRLRLEVPLVAAAWTGEEAEGRLERFARIEDNGKGLLIDKGVTRVGKVEEVSDRPNS